MIGAMFSMVFPKSANPISVKTAAMVGPARSTPLHRMRSRPKIPTRTAFRNAPPTPPHEAKSFNNLAGEVCNLTNPLKAWISPSSARPRPRNSRSTIPITT
nr:hypothetical protein [Spirochaeta thermophila]